MWPFTTPYPERSTQQLNSEYDYIVVGGGTAGCVLARRLAEDKRFTVLLIERGDAGDSWRDRCPLLSTHHFSDGKHSVTMEAANDGPLAQPAILVTGVGLGGCSRINGTQYSRGPPADFNAWAESGCEGWGYEDLVPYFEKAECLYKATTKNHYGGNGPWQVQTPRPFQFGVSERFTRAAEKLGLADIQDVNDPLMPTSGCFRVHHTVDRHGQRSSTFNAYLSKQFVLEHDNLDICTRTLVHKINIHKSSTGDLEAVGVVLQSHEGGSPLSITARKEVVLSAGALWSPQILLLSGVGPEKHLSEVGIPVMKTLDGVGSSLQDHLGVRLDFNCPINDSILALTRQPLTLISQIGKYLFQGEGCFTSASTIESCILAQSDLLDDEASSLRPLTDANKDASRPENIPDIEIMACFIADPRHPKFEKSMGGAAFLAGLLRPVSKGTVRLRSPDPSDHPVFDMQYLSSPADYLVLRQALRLCMSIAAEMRASGYDFRDVVVPDDMDDTTLDAFINEGKTSLFHYSGSCRMGEEKDPAGPGVVDKALRVHGIRRLRVCDASVFPHILAAHIQAPVVAMAEKCADLIKTANLS